MISSIVTHWYSTKECLPPMGTMAFVRIFNQEDGQIIYGYAEFHCQHSPNGWLGHTFTYDKNGLQYFTAIHDRTFKQVTHWANLPDFENELVTE